LFYGYQITREGSLEKEADNSSHGCQSDLRASLTLDTFKRSRSGRRCIKNVAANKIASRVEAFTREAIFISGCSLNEDLTAGAMASEAPASEGKGSAW